MSEERVQYGDKPQVDPDAISMLVVSGDVTQVQAAIRAKYGFEPSAEYCRDLIAFVEEISREMVNL